MRMSRRLLVFVCLIFPAGLAVAEATPIPLHETAQPVPAITFQDLSGNATTLDAWRGKVVLLNIWATWCVPCRVEMPTLDRLEEQLGSERFAVLALSIDRAGIGVVERFFDEINIARLEIFIDESGRAARDLGIIGLPTTILIAPDGRELGRFIGPAEWDAPEMITFLRIIIAKQNQGN